MRRLLQGSVCLLLLGSTPVYAERGSESLDEATDTTAVDRRDREVIAGFARNFTDEFVRCRIDPWHEFLSEEHNTSDQLQLARLASVAYLLLNSGDFPADVVTQVDLWCPDLDPPPPPDPNDPPPPNYRDKLVDYLKTIRVSQPEESGTGGSIGTDGDYDMTMVMLANMLYLLTHEEGILDSKQRLSDAAYGILCQNGGSSNWGCEYSGTPYPDPPPKVEFDGMNAYFAFELHGNYFSSEMVIPFLEWVIIRPETENHVLSIYAYNYLVSMWILRMGLDSTEGMSPEIQAWAQEGHEWLKQPGNKEKFFSPILQALGRVVHNGYFETNARPYQELSVFAILSLAIYGDIFADRPLPNDVSIDKEIVAYASRVRQAARNAMHYTAASYAFQSMRGKRSAPMRRRDEYRDKVWDFYSNNRMAFLFGLLSGAHEYDDCTESSGSNPSCDLMDYTKLKTRTREFWAAVGRLSARKAGRLGYELPRAIHGHFFDPRSYFAILQARASLGQYPQTGKAAQYFDPNDPTRTQLPGKWRGSPELYFGTGDLVLAAGGMYDIYYNPQGLPYEGAEMQYDFWSRATMLFARGDFGQIPTEADKPTQWKDLRDGSEKDVLVMRGRRDEPYMSDCNVWTYKSFAYGYNFDPTVHSDWAEGWAQDYPLWWENLPNQSFQIEETPFKLFYFEKDALGLGVGAETDGYYVIMARLRKADAAYQAYWWFYNYQRGIVEVVPGNMYPTLDALRAEIEDWHRPEFGYLSGGKDDNHRPFRYVTMTSHERLTLDPKMGADPSVGPVPIRSRSYCRDGIQKIETLADPTSGAAASNDDAHWLEIDRKGLYIPRRIRENGQRREIPLARVWELDDKYRLTGHMFMEELDRGKLAIRRPTVKEIPVGQVTVEYPAWDCLIVDSHDHTQPSEVELSEQFDYRMCNAGGFDRHKVRSVAVGTYSTCAVSVFGRLYCWGDNSYGQLGTGDHQSSQSPRVTRLWEGNEAVAVGGYHACALRSDGTVRCWGRNSFGQLGDGTIIARMAGDLPVLRDADEPLMARSIAAGHDHTCALGQDGEVFCWGANHLGQVGRLGSSPFETYANQVDLPQRAVAVTAGAYHSCALLSGGTVFCWGMNDHGQLGNGSFEGGPQPRQVDFPVEALGMPGVEIAAGWAHTCAIVHAEYNIRRAFCWGANNALQLGVVGASQYEDSPLPRRVTAFGPEGNTSAPIVQLAPGIGHTCVRDESDAVFCWGANFAGQLGDPATPDFSAEAVEVLGLLPETRFLSRGGTASHVCAVDRDDQLRCWGSHYDGQLGTGDPPDADPHYLPTLVAWP
ncbi:MAG: hypothetical protein RBU30_10460 [Polyangia bacterium]|jgi:alpha-tubulin suppressor-like RCC1 family protein|nr:hypothetical protein [Polyangia bacterium]